MGRRWSDPRWLIDVAAVLGLSTLAVTVVVTVVLTATYRPGSSGATEAWLVAHEAAASIGGMAAFAFFLLLVWPVRRPVPWRRPAPIVASAVATFAVAAAILTRDLVAWDNLAFWAVVVGSDISGYWVAAFDDGVRFIVVDGQEIGQSTYARALVVHLLAPFLALGALAVAWRSVQSVRGSVGVAGSSTVSSTA